jgi:3-methyladenine DNA glycosylase AlkD
MPARGSAKKAAKKRATPNPPRALAAVIDELQKRATKKYRVDMSARYGIVTKAPVYGTPVGTLRQMAKAIGCDHALAEALWRTGIHDARMLATMVDDPAQVTAAQMPAMFGAWILD